MDSEICSDFDVGCVIAKWLWQAKHSRTDSYARADLNLNSHGHADAHANSDADQNSNTNAD